MLISSVRQSDAVMHSYLNLWLPKGKYGGGGRYFRRLELTYTHYLYKIINKDLLYSTGNAIQYSE